MSAFRERQRELHKWSQRAAQKLGGARNLFCHAKCNEIRYQLYDHAEDYYEEMNAKRYCIAHLEVLR